MSEFFLKVGDRSPSIAATLTVNGLPIGNLTAASVRFRMRALYGPANVYKVDAAAVIVDPVTCAVRYDWLPGDVDTAGTFVAEWITTYANGTVQTVPNADSQVVYISPGV